MSVEDALGIIAKEARVLSPIESALEEAIGLVVAKEILAPISLPPFDNSAVDGFALGGVDESQKSYEVIETIAAGDSPKKMLSGGQAARIMTGALIPQGTKTVVMQEHVQLESNVVNLLETPKFDDNIRKSGEDIQKGDTVISAGTTLGTKHVGVLSALGMDIVSVYRKPTVSILSTGSELVDPGQPLMEGQVYYCTGPMISSLCRENNVDVVWRAKLSDDEHALLSSLKEAITADVIIMVGGMAGGQFDFGRKVFEKMGVSAVFFEGEWRPGKPLFFGQLGKKLVFGLPGNPVAAFVMFKVFIEPALRGLKGQNPENHWLKAELKGTPKNINKAQFLRALKTEDGLELLPGQGSHQLFSLSQANGICWIPPHFTKNAKSEVLYLPLLT